MRENEYRVTTRLEALMRDNLAPMSGAGKQRTARAIGDNMLIELRSYADAVPCKTAEQEAGFEHKISPQHHRLA